MKITVITVGKIKEKFYRDAIDEYVKRLGKYSKIEILEAADEKTAEKMSEIEENMIKEKEAERILRYINPDDYVITLEIGGKKMDSVSFSRFIDDLKVKGNSHIQFVIGGSLGLHKSVSDISNYKLSFSDMTFPHQLMRVILMEQIYRACRISAGEPYHK